MRDRRKRMANAGRGNAGRLDNHLDFRQRNQRRRVRSNVGAAIFQRLAKRRRGTALRLPTHRRKLGTGARGVGSATPTTCRPRVSRAWARNIAPNLPAPISPTVIGRPGRLAFA